MLRKLSKLVLKGSDSHLPKEQVVRVGRASKVGTDHGNEDEIRVSDSLGGSDGEDELDLSEALTSFLSLMPTEQDLFIDQILFVACFDGHGGPGCAKFMGETLHKKVLKIMRCALLFFFPPALVAPLKQQKLTPRGLTRRRATSNKEISTEEQFASVKKDIIVETFREAEDEWLKKAAIVNDTSGACAVMCLMLHRDLIIGHCGDCRAVVRNPNGSTIELTKDHRAVDPDEMARIVAAGGTVVRERVMGVLAPSRSFGDLDVKQKCPPGVVIAVPDINTYSVPEEAGKFAFMILATDGVFDVISSKSACDFVARVLDRYAACARTQVLTRHAPPVASLKAEAHPRSLRKNSCRQRPSTTRTM